MKTINQRTNRIVILGAGYAGLRFSVGLPKLAPPGFVPSIEEVKGWPALVLRVNGATHSVTSIETDGEQIVAVRSVLNPDKLRHL